MKRTYQLTIAAGKETAKLTFTSKTELLQTMRDTMKNWRRYGRIVFGAQRVASEQMFSRGWTATWDNARGSSTVIGASLKFGSSRYVAATMRWAEMG